MLGFLPTNSALGRILEEQLPWFDGCLCARIEAPRDLSEPGLREMIEILHEGERVAFGLDYSMCTPEYVERMLGV